MGNVNINSGLTYVNGQVVNGPTTSSTVPGLPGSIPVVVPPQPPYQAPPTNQLNVGSATTSGSGSADNQLLNAIFQVIEAIDPAAAPVIQQVQQQLGLTSGTGGSGSGVGTTSSTGGGSGGSGVGTSSPTFPYSSASVTGGVAGSSYAWNGYVPTSASANYGTHNFQTSKDAVMAACQAEGVSPSNAANILSVLSMETNDGTPDERDASKDGATDGSKNYSAFNMNASMLKFIGFDPDAPGAPNLNDPKNLPLVVHLLDKAMSNDPSNPLTKNGTQSGLQGFLAYHRGGSSGFEDGSSYDVGGYVSNFKQNQADLANNPSLMTEGGRLKDSWTAGGAS